ncbi:LytR/AlgR family response regulator transcription factor [Paenibacillus koleovorans]|uniref:LytR/AlgR family response regulator transcription factor n=1 Tax=Paenibacillus koleovorans TaxID=121608 RepID=UPI000FDB13DF|nr:response regulator [Paenibacillus koleovorans]
MVIHGTVLIAEEDAGNRQLMQSYVKEAGMTVLDCVSTGKRLVDSYLRHRPDLLIVDIRLEKLDGISACKIILDQGFFPQIIIATSSSDSRHYKAGYELGVVDYIEKPIERNRFLKAMERVHNRVHLLGAMPPTFIACKFSNRTKHMNQQYVIYIEKMDNRTSKIVLRSGEIVETSTSLKDLHAQFTLPVFFPHRSFLVNTSYICSVSPDLLVEGNYVITLFHCEQRIPMSRRSYPSFVSMTQHLGSVKGF